MLSLYYPGVHQMMIQCERLTVFIDYSIDYGFYDVNSRLIGDRVYVSKELWCS